MRYGEGLLEEILRRTDLVKLVGRRVKLARKGRVFWGLCPFHKEKSPSFKVENERRNYHCFGCGAGGSAFKWLQETEGLSFPEAVQRLAGEAGVELPAWTPEDEAREAKRKSLYDVIELACRFFEEQLNGRAGEPARRYLQSRGLKAEAQKRFRLGYAPDSNGALLHHLRAQGIDLGDMVEAGLVRPADGDRAPRDFFYDRLMFPIADPRGRIVAFGGRGFGPRQLVLGAVEHAGIEAPRACLVSLLNACFSAGHGNGGQGRVGGATGAGQQRHGQQAVSEDHHRSVLASG